MRLLPSLMVCLLLMAGCGPAVPREELGTIEGKLPELPGMERPYDMPDLDAPVDAAPEATEHDQPPE